MGQTTYYRRNNNSLDFDTRVISVVTTGTLVTLAQVKNYVRIDHTQDDDLLTNMISQAEAIAEGYLNRDIRSRRRSVFYPQLDNEVELFFAPLDRSQAIAVTIDGVATTDFEILGHDDPIIRLGIYPAQEVEITYTTRALTGATIQQAILAIVWNLYKTKEEGMREWKSLLAPYKKLYI